jgi:hypothetical protein
MGLLIAIISVGMGVALIVRRVVNRKMDEGGE